MLGGAISANVLRNMLVSIDFPLSISTGYLSKSKRRVPRLSHKQGVVYFHSPSVFFSA